MLFTHKYSKTSCHRWRLCCFPETPKSKCTRLISYLAHHDLQPTNQSILLQLSQVLTFGMGTFDQIGYGKVQRISTKALRSTKPSTKLLSFNSCGSSLSGFSNFGLLHSMRKTEDAYRPIINFLPRIMCFGDQPNPVLSNIRISVDYRKQMIGCRSIKPSTKNFFVTKLLFVLA